jgi:hypothetical protein
MILRLDSWFAGYDYCRENNAEAGVGYPYRRTEHDLSTCTVTAERLLEQGFQLPSAYIQYTQDGSHLPSANYSK